MTLLTAGRIAGTGAALGAAALWAMFLVRNPYAPPAIGRVLTFGGLMMLASLLAAGAAARGAHLAMYLLFAVLFFPVGLTVLLGPGVFSAIGWLNLGYLAATVLVHRAIVAGSGRKGPSGDSSP